MDSHKNCQTATGLSVVCDIKREAVRPAYVKASACVANRGTNKVNAKIGEHRNSHQQGMALAVALILLFVVTLVGLAAVSGTIMQNKMAANQYDRQLAFQAASSAMEVAKQAILSSASAAVRNCKLTVNQCLSNPFEDPNLPNNSIKDVPTASYQPTGAVTGTPEYVIENLGQWVNPSSDTGFNQTANSSQYGAQGKSSMATFYRVTVRSADPKDVQGHAIVTLQAIVMQG